MFKDLKIRVLITVIVVGVCLYFLLPSLMPEVPSSLKTVLPKEKIHLGLDLQGGMNLLLEVETQKALDSVAERTANDLKEAMIGAKIRFRDLEKGKDATISLELANKESSDAFAKLLKDSYPDFEIGNSEISQGREKLVLKINDKRARQLRKSAVEQSLETIRNRIDQFGVSEPEIVPQGEDRIMIQLPGIKDPKRAINLIGRTALLEFKLVDEEHNVNEALAGNVPPGDMILYGSERASAQRAAAKVPYLLKAKTLMTGASIEKAEVRISDRFGEPHVAITFNSQGAKDFDRITAENVKKRLAIILDDVVYSAPVIQERISGGNAQITGSFSDEDAKDLAIVLRAGALPAPVKILEQVTVGPSLGQDSIQKGILSILIGFALVVVFMIVYYKWSGVVANIALLLNVVLILGTLALFKATLTLPGLAGIVLTIGMAVDANVLIYERTREEIRAGKTPRAAIEAGYSKAMVTILDSNITTLIAALFLFQFGTGPIKGFAITLSIGLIFSMFTAVFVCRIIFDYYVWNKKIKALSI